MASRETVMLNASEGRALTIMGNRMVLKATRDDTAGAFSLIEYTAVPGFPGPALHIHEQTDEAFYVLEGELTFTRNDEAFSAGPGSFVFVPRGVPHTFANPGNRPARFLTFVLPGGFEGYLLGLADILSSADGPPNDDIMSRLMRKHDIVPAVVAVH